MPDFGTLQIRSIIVHDVPWKSPGEDGDQPILSEVASSLTTPLKNYFKERITEGITSGAFAVEFDDSSSSPVPERVLSLIEGGDLVAGSQAIANHLFACQTGSSPAGLLTERTRLYKIAMFVREGDEPDEIFGAVADKQRGFRPRTEVARFFLEKFLGCRLTEAPEVTTKRFFTGVQRFINEEVADPQRKARYEVALLAEVESASSTLNPPVFAGNHLIGQDRQRLLNWLRENELPVGEFPKDPELIRTQLARIQITFAKNIMLIVPPTVLEEDIQMTPLDGGETKVEFEGEVRRFEGRR